MMEHNVKEIQRGKENFSVRAEDVTIIHKECHNYLCKGNHIKKKMSNYICVDKNFPGRVEKRNYSSKRDFRDDVHLGME